MLEREKTSGDRLLILLPVAAMASVFVLPMPMDSLLGIVILVLLVRRVRAGRGIPAEYRDPLLLCALLLVMLLGLSVLRTGGSAEAIAQVWLRILLWLCVVLALSLACREPEPLRRTFSRWVACAAGIGALICLGIADDPFAAGYRLEGFFRLNSPGKLGYMYAAVPPILLAGMPGERPVWRLLMGGVFALSLLIVYLTDTRAAWLGAALGLLVLGIAWRAGNRKRFFAITATCIVALGLVVGVVLLLAGEELRQALLPRGDSYRLTIWRFHLREILERAPLFGQGMLRELTVTSGPRTFHGAHNMYLATALHTGVVGLCNLLVLLAWMVLRLSANLDKPLARMALSLLCVGLAVFTFHGDRLIDKLNFVYFAIWLPLGVALALAWREQRLPLFAPQPAFRGRR